MLIKTALFCEWYLQAIWEIKSTLCGHLDLAMAIDSEGTKRQTWC